MFRRFVMTMWLLTFVVGSATIVQGQTLGPEHSRLIERLVQKGDGFRKTDAQEANVTYSLALFFAGDKALREKIETRTRGLVGVTAMNLTAAQTKRLTEALRTIDLDACGSSWPSRTSESNLVNLRMLLDDRLFDTRATGAVNFSGVGCHVFVATPKISIAEVRTAFGQPGAVGVRKDGSETLTYGAFKIAGDKNGMAVAIMFAGQR